MRDGELRVENQLLGVSLHESSIRIEVRENDVLEC